MKHHFIGLCAGLGSSKCWRYIRWAQEFSETLRVHYEDNPNVHVEAFSSDGKGERKFFEQVETHRKNKTLGVVFGAGHSNGARDWLLAASSLPRVRISYLAIIDLAMFDYVYGAVAGNNIEYIEEFWAGLETVDFVENWEGIHKFHDLRELGHVEVAEHPQVQNKMFLSMTEILDPVLRREDV